jgi:hypothetical protein
LAILEPQKQIVKFLITQREKGLSFNSIRLNLHAIYHFYEMNDVPLNKKKINMFKGELKTGGIGGVFNPIDFWFGIQEYFSLPLASILVPECD